MARALTMMMLLVAAITMPSFAGSQPYASMTNCGLEIKPYVVQGQPVVLRFQLENTSFEPEVFNLGYDREGAFRFKLQRPDGSWVALPQKTVRQGISRTETVTIQPREKYSQQLILDDWYTFTERGSYRVSVTALKACPALDLDFEIAAPDAERLSEVCGELVDEVRKNKDNYEKSSDAAKVLAKFGNPIVVPFLMKALEANPMVDSILIPAIERIGDKEAVRFLISPLEQHQSESLRYELVRPALVRLEKRSAPEEVEVIRIALARFPAP